MTTKDRDYETFLDSKAQLSGRHGFKPLWMPDFLFGFQKALTSWAIERGRAAIIADCGLGKSPMELVWAENVVRHTNKPVLLLSPLAVSNQMVREADKFGIECRRSNDGTVFPNITATNYERLHYFKPDDFGGVVCDESSILKNFTGQRKKDITRFMAKIKYRLLGTATAAPNDFIELGTSSEALGELPYMDVLQRFFVDDKDRIGSDKPGAASYSAERQAARVHGYWRLKGHSERHFWKWVCSWARACRKPSDLGFPDDDFKLPPLRVKETRIENEKPLPGEMFIWKAVSLADQRAELRATLEQRCRKIAELVKPHPISVMWCDLNDEGDMLEEMVPNTVQLAGKDSDDKKEAIIEWFLGQKCICDSHKFRCKLAACGNPNTTQQDVRNTLATFASASAANSNAARQAKTDGTCGLTIAQIRVDGRNAHRSNEIGATPLEGGSIKPIHLSATSSSGQRGNGSDHTPQAENGSISKNTGSRLSNSMGCSKRKAENAQSVDIQTPDASEHSRSLTIATLPERLGGCSAHRAILESESSRIASQILNQQSCTCGYISGVRRLVTKGKILGFGLNFQHCRHTTFFPSHSWEKYYQSVRRFWRFGQTEPVDVDIVTTEGEAGVLQNLQRKSAQADKMFDNLVAEMNHSLQIERNQKQLKHNSLPEWIPTKS